MVESDKIFPCFLHHLELKLKGVKMKERTSSLRNHNNGNSKETSHESKLSAI